METSPDPKSIERYEQEAWTRCAEKYTDGFGSLVCEAISPLLDAAEVRAGSRVLDVGTGPGLVAGAVLDRRGLAVGIDFSDAMLSQARRSYPEIEFVQANAESLPFDEGHFDAVVGNFVFHHLARPGKVLAEARRVLRPGGKVAFTVWADPAKLAAFGLFFSAIEKHGNPQDLPHGPLFGVSEFDVYHEMLRQADFRDSSVGELDTYWRGSSIDALWDAFVDWAQLDAAPGPMRQAVESSFRENAEPFKSDGVLAIPNPAILVSGTK